MPGKYRMDVFVSDANGMSGVVSSDLNVQNVPWQVKVAIATIGFASAAVGAWLVFHTRAFWLMRAASRRASYLHSRNIRLKSYLRGGAPFMGDTVLTEKQHRARTLYQRLNGPLHAPALWIFMMIIVAHWLEHVFQIYQIYALGWAPANAGGILGVMYPKLIESETLHFVYDFIQWAGIVLLLPGFTGRARAFWTVAMIVQTWHYIEHVLLMGQYLTGYYLFGAAKQTSILQLWFPRPELHFVYNLLVFIPMVIAVQYYIKPKLITLALLDATTLEEHAQEVEQI
jgi:hypothetical protein